MFKPFVTQADHSWLPTIHGLRAFAIMAVLVSHSYHSPDWAFGNVGVAVFFSISGFLSYYVLYRDEQHLGRIDYNYFLLRRILRIWPAALVVILLATLFASGAARTNATAVSLFTFSINWDMVFFTGWPLPNLAPLWSIAVEQQFYVLAPFMYRLLRSRYALGFCIAVFALSNLGRYVHIVMLSDQAGNGGLYYATYAYLDTFLAGAIVAHLFLGGRKISACMQWWAFIISTMLLLAILRIWGGIVFPPYASFTLLPYLLMPMAVTLLLLSVMPMQQGSTAFAKLLVSRPFTVVGTLSYSLYLIHLLVLEYTHGYHLAVQYVACLLAAALLYVLVEKPFLKYKSQARKGIGQYPWPALLVWAVLALGTLSYW